MYPSVWKKVWLSPAIAAAVALPVVCLAADEKKADSSISVSAKSGQVTTVEGRLISLHEFMTAGASASDQTSARAQAPAGRAAVTSAASGPWALQTGTDIIILSNMNAATGAQRLGRSSGQPEDREARIGGRPNAETSSNRDLLDRDDDVAGIDRPVAQPGLSDRSDLNRPEAKSPDEAEGAILGIPRHDLDKAGQRVKATGTLYNRNGLKYMVVSSVSAAESGSDATRPQSERGGLNQNQNQKQRSGTESRTGAERATETEVEFEQETERNEP